MVLARTKTKKEQPLAGCTLQQHQAAVGAEVQGTWAVLQGLPCFSAHGTPMGGISARGQCVGLQLPASRVPRSHLVQPGAGCLVSRKHQQRLWVPFVRLGGGNYTVAASEMCFGGCVHPLRLFWLQGECLLGLRQRLGGTAAAGQNVWCVEVQQCTWSRVATIQQGWWVVC